VSVGRPFFMTFRWIAASLLCFAFGIAAQGQITDEYVTTADFYHPIQGPLSGYGKLGYTKNPLGDYASYYVEWPGITYTCRPWVQFWFATRYTYTNNEIAQDREELRPFTGVKFILRTKRKINLFNYTRYEYHAVYSHETRDWTSFSRVRNRVGAEIPLASPGSAWKPGTFYTPIDIEPSYQFGLGRNGTKVRGGFGYVANDHVRLEFIYIARFRFRTSTDGLDFDGNTFRFNIKVGTQHGILQRVLNQ
jgi:hypothetical protein